MSATNIDELQFAFHQSIDDEEEYDNTVSEISKEEYEDIACMEKHFFHEMLKSHPVSKHEIITNRLKYLREYCMKHPMWNGDNYQPLHAPFAHYQSREVAMKELGFDEVKFYSFDEIQEVIKELGLEPEPTMEMIVFFLYLVKSNTKNQNKTAKEEILEIIAEIEESGSATMSIKAGKNKHQISNVHLIHSILQAFSRSNSYSQYLIVPQPRNSQYLRQEQYLLVQNLLDNLPTKVKKGKKQLYTQAERTFGLCVLYICDYLKCHSKEELPFVCGKYNNATFDKLMRDFKKKNVKLSIRLN